MLSVLSTFNNREISYLALSPDLTEVSALPVANWLVIPMADQAQIPFLDAFAKACLERSVLYMCALGEAGSAADDAFDLAEVMNQIEKGNDVSDEETFKNSPMTTWHSNYAEGLWYAIYVATTDTGPIEKIVIADLTGNPLKPVFEDLLLKLRNGLMP